MRRLLTWLFGWHFHDWTQWEVQSARHNTVSGSFSFDVQMRTCKLCGYKVVERL